MSDDLPELRAREEAMLADLGRMADGEHARPQLLNDLGNLSLALFDRTGEENRLGAAAVWYEAAWEDTREEDPRRAHFAANQATCELDRFRVGGDRAHLVRAEERSRVAIELAPADSGALHTLANVLHARFRSSGDEAALDEAALTRKAALDALPKRSGRRARLLIGSGNTWYALYELRGDPEMLEAAIAAHGEALAIADRDQVRAAALTNLGNCLRERALRLHSRADLDEAIKNAGKALELTEPSDPHFAARKSNLGDLYRQRYEWFDDTDDLYRAVGFLAEAVRLTPAGRPQYPILLGNFGLALSNGYRRIGGGRENLDRAVECLRGALARIPPDHPDHLRWAANLANTLRVSYLDGGALTDLAEAVELLERAVAGTARTDPSWATRVHNLATVLHARLPATGAPNDLDRAIEHYATAITAAPSGTRVRVAATAGLGSTLGLRFALRGEADDLHAGITLLKQALEDAGASDADRPTWLSNLGAALTRLYRHTRNEDALDEAVQCLIDAVDGTSDGHQDRSLRLRTLGAGLSLRYEARAEPADLEASVTVCEAAVAVAAPSDRGHACYELGSALLSGRDPSADRIERGIEVLEEAARLFPPANPDHVIAVRMLAIAHRMLVPLADGKAAFHEADRAVQLLEATLDPDGEHYERSATVTLYELARAYRDRSVRQDSLIARRRDADLARSAGLRLLHARQDDALIQSTTADALAVARRTADASLLVARWCLEDGEVAEALQALELGRGFVNRAAALSGSVVGRLAAVGRDDLAREWEAEITRALDRGVGPDTLVPGGVRRRIVQALTEGDRALIPPVGPEEVGAALGAAGRAALVYLVPGHTTRPGQAVIVPWHGEPEALELPTFRAAPDGTLDRYVRAYNRYLRVVAGQVESDTPDPETARDSWIPVLDELCDWAWESVMAEVLPRIRALDPAPDAGPEPFVVLVPVGHAALVPWHAARTGGRYLIEDVVVGYAASASLLCATGRRGRLPLDGRALIIGNPTFVLRYAEAEAAQIQRHCYPGGRYIPPPREQGDPPATPDDILAELAGSGPPGAPVIHLACHGTVAADPAWSRLILAAGQALTVERLLAHGRRDERREVGPLVVLSACMSGMSTDTFDESLTLATAFLIAGAADAVGSLWLVDERWTADLMTSFHVRFTTDEPDPGRALRAAQLELLAAAPDGGSAAPYGWAAFIHQGG